MRFASALARALRAPIRLYSRLSPINIGKVKLIYWTRRLETSGNYLLGVKPADKKRALLPNGTVMMADLSEAVQRLIYFLGRYEPGVSRIITESLKPGDTFIDIGAHVGYFTLLASSGVGPTGKICSFEPMPEVFLDLERNIRLNNLGNVQAVRKAVFDSDRELEIFMPVAGNSGTATFFKRPNASGSSIKCQATTLDSFINKEGIEQVRLIKMDIEGAEPFALRGMSSLLSSPCPPDIICEAVPYLLEFSSHKQQDLVAFLENFGYVGKLITDNGLAEFDPNRRQSPTAECNLFFRHHRSRIGPRSGGPTPNSNNQIIAENDR